MTMQPSSRLLQAMAAHGKSQGRAPGGRLARALAGKDAKHLSLAALPTYGEPQFADKFGPLPGSDPYGAFQGDAFQPDGYQTEVF